MASNSRVQLEIELAQFMVKIYISKFIALANASILQCG